MRTDDPKEQRKVSKKHLLTWNLESLKADFIYENVGGLTKNQNVLGQLSQQIQTSNQS